jgi:hypothetical protein
VRVTDSEKEKMRSWLSMLLIALAIAQVRGEDEVKQVECECDCDMSTPEETPLVRPVIDWDSIERRTTNETNALWVVLRTSSFGSSVPENICRLSEAGWTVLVVEDQGFTGEVSEACLFLSLSAQIASGYATFSKTRWGVSRINIGVLYALQHGARVIYENGFRYKIKTGYPLNIPYSAGDAMMTLMYDCQDDFINVASYFGWPQYWLRGFPLECLKYSDQYLFRKANVSPAIQTFLIDGIPGSHAHADARTR